MTNHLVRRHLTPTPLTVRRQLTQARQGLLDITAYLATIGGRLTRYLPLNQLKFQFFLVDLPDANAFVLPGGRVYVSRKLVSAAQNEDELAAVIAHELGHLVAHQSAIDVTRQ